MSWKRTQAAKRKNRKGRRVTSDQIARAMRREMHRSVEALREAEARREIETAINHVAQARA